MTAFIRSMNGLVAMGMTLALACVWPAIATAQYQQQQQRPQLRQQVEPAADEDKEDGDKEDEDKQNEEGPKPEYSKDFIKIAGKVQKADDSANEWTRAGP